MKKINKILLLSLCVLSAASVAPVFAMKNIHGMACCKGHFGDYIQYRIDYINERIIFIKNKGNCKTVGCEKRLENLKNTVEELLSIQGKWNKEKVDLALDTSYEKIEPYKKQIDIAFNCGYYEKNK